MTPEQLKVYRWCQSMPLTAVARRIVEQDAEVDEAAEEIERLRAALKGVANPHMAIYEMRRIAREALGDE